MKPAKLLFPLILICTTLACSFDNTGQVPASSTSTVTPFDQTQGGPESTSIHISSTGTLFPASTLTVASTSAPTKPPTSTPIPTVESLKARVTADKLSCRYGPGAEYLYLYALNQTANIKLIGRTDANNWVWVDGDNKCWVNAKFLEIQGNPKSLPIVYPGKVKLPVSPYYPGPKWAKATRNGDSVEVTWEAVPISPGKYEDENMHQYILEVWRCENGEILFETLGTNFPFITIKKDEAGCEVPSHGRVFVQEKHGYGGPVEIPWPAHE